MFLFIRRLGDDRLALAASFGVDAARRDRAALHEPRSDTFGATLTERVVVRLAAARIGVARDPQLHLGVVGAAHEHAQISQRRERLGSQRVFVDVEQQVAIDGEWLAALREKFRRIFQRFIDGDLWWRWWRRRWRRAAASACARSAGARATCACTTCTVPACAAVRARTCAAAARITGTCASSTCASGT